MAANTVTLGSLTFNGAADGNGTLWKLFADDGLDGWDGTPTRTSFLPRVGAHGSILAESQYDAREITMRGAVSATSNTLAWSAWNSLISTADLASSDATLTVNEENPKRATVRRDGTLRMRWVSNRAFTFELPLVAADPRKYSTTENTSSI